MDLLKFYLNGVLIFLFMNYSKGQHLPEGSLNRVTECEGTILRGSCPINNVIAVKDVQYGTTNCALHANDSECCDYESTDCLIDYTVITQQAACSGRGVCNEVTIGQVDTSSCGAPYPDQNHYLTMEYYCLPKSRIGEMCDSVTLAETGSPLYTWNNDYPAGTIRAASTSCSCSVETSSCNSQINVYFVHFELSDGGGMCSDNQNVQIDDKGSIKTYTCSQNNKYEITIMMTSSSNYISVTLNNTAGIADGKFWIGFEATESNSPLKISCPSNEQTICKDCPGLIPPTNGILSSTDVTTGTNIDVLCDSGYTLFGEATLDCQTNGTWSAEVGTCQKDCLDLTPPTSGSLSTTDVTTGTSVDVLCDSGYTLFGEATLHCQTNKTWSAEVGSCQKDCPGLTPPSNGSLSTTSVTTGTNVNVLCDSGYTLFGEATLDCQTNGTWSAEAGTCQKDCPDLTPPTNGNLSTTDVTARTNVDVLCDSDYTLFGEATVTCQTNGTWSAEVGTCHKGLGDTCTLSSDCSAVAYATCNNNVCACVEGYTQSNNECTSASSGANLGQREGLSIGAIVVIVIGAVVFVIIVCCLVIFYIRKQTGAVSNKKDDISPNGAIPTNSEDIAPSLMTKSPGTEVLFTSQSKCQMRSKVALGETVDQGLSPLDTVFRPPHFTSCDLTDIHMPERASPNHMYQDDAYQSFADTEFRPPRLTSCSFSDIHIPERPTPYRMYRDDSAYGSFEESLPPVETT